MAYVAAFYKEIGAVNWTVYEVDEATASSISIGDPVELMYELEALNRRPLASGMTEIQAQKYIEAKKRKQ